MRRHVWLALVACCLAAACGTAPSGSAVRRPAAAVDPIPAQDTPIAQAPPALAALWRPEDVTLIPGREVFSLDRAAPIAVNDTGGAMTDVQAQEISERGVQENKLFAWALENKQPALVAHLDATALAVDPYEVLAAEGYAYHTPSPCGIYPLTLSVHPSSPAVLAEMARFQVDTKADPDPFLLVSEYAPCHFTATSPSGQVVDEGDGATEPIIYLAAWRDDPLLGRVVFYDAAFLCSQSPAFQQVCSS